MSKIGMIGDSVSVLAFRALGIDTFPCASAQEAREALKERVKEGYTILYITEGLCRHMEEMIAQYATKPTPAIIPLPGVDGSYGIGQAGVTRAVVKAVGADMEL